MKKRELAYKLVGKQILYFNGQVWLVKESLRTTTEAKALIKELNKQNG